MPVVIADAGPLIALSRIDHLELLKSLFQYIIITDTVHNEIFDNTHKAGKPGIKKAIEEEWIQVKNVNTHGWQPLNKGVDAGEASAIFLAMEQTHDTLMIIDDKAGRLEARYHKITIIGTAAVIGLAKLEGIIPSARDVLHKMRDADYYIADEIIKVILLDIGEQN